jgi:CDP-diacylglycerol---serine O-phosphatidyltransferase
MKPIRTIAMLPSLFTLGNLVCGFFAIVVAANLSRPTSAALDPTDSHYLMISGWLIFLAMVFDAVDGHVARLSNATSDFGAELDSLCDLVSFGVAPAFLLVKMCPQFEMLHREAVWIIAAMYVACAALRLARFNVETDEDIEDHMTFSGLPSPAAAAALAGFAIMFNTLRSENNPLPYADQIDLALQLGLPIFAAVLALLMVSRIRYPHVANQMLRGQRTFGYLVLVLFFVIALAMIRDYAVPIVCTLYTLVGPLGWGGRLFRSKKKARIDSRQE